MGAPENARVYVAGGKPFGGLVALQPLAAEFPNLVTKEKLAREDELSPYLNRSSALAAIDYIVSLNSDVFVPSHGGNMGRAMQVSVIQSTAVNTDHFPSRICNADSILSTGQGHRAYVGHRKFIRPNKRVMLPFFDDSSISDAELGSIMRKLHEKSQGHPEPRINKRDRDVTAYPVPQCMCKHR